MKKYIFQLYLVISFVFSCQTQEPASGPEPDQTGEQETGQITEQTVEQNTESEQPEESVSSQEADKSIQADEFPVGLWFVDWIYSESMGGYAPGSYAAAGIFQNDYFYYFRSDGTGIFISRWLVVDENREFIAIISEFDRDTGEYKTENITNAAQEFTWKPESCKLLIIYEEKNESAESDEKIYTYKKDESRTRNLITETMDGYKILEEYEIIELIRIRRVDPSRTVEFLDQYDIES